MLSSAVHMHSFVRLSPHAQVTLDFALESISAGFFYSSALSVHFYSCRVSLFSALNNEAF